MNVVYTNVLFNYIIRVLIHACATMPVCTLFILALILCQFLNIVIIVVLIMTLSIW